MPKPDPIAAAIAATSKPTGRVLKLPALLAQLPQGTRDGLDQVFRSDLNAAHLTRVVNHLLRENGIEDRVVERTVRDHRERLARG